MSTTRSDDGRSNVRPIRRDHADSGGAGGTGGSDGSGGSGDGRGSGRGWSRVEVWRGHGELTPRQAAAMVLELHTIADMVLARWQRDPGEPLHELAPFDQLDRRALIHVDENRAWVAEAQDRCQAVAEGILRGDLPHDGKACYFDELAVYAACAIAADAFADNRAEGVFAAIPDDPRDGEWPSVTAWLVDEMRSNAHLLFPPITPGNPHVTAELAEHHPFTWFDLA